MSKSIDEILKKNMSNKQEIEHKIPLIKNSKIFWTKTLKIENLRKRNY